MNMLIISYFSGNDGLACSHHIDDRVDALAEYGVKPIVLSSLCAEKSSRYKKYRVPSLSASGLRFELRYITKRYFKKTLTLKLVQLPFLLVLLPFYFIESIVCNLGSSCSWFILAGLCSVFISKRNRCEIVYSSGGSPSAHIAGYICKKLTGLKWIAELQDPIVGSWMNKFEMKFNLYIERIIADKADSVVFMTHGSLDCFQIRHKLFDRGHVIYPGANECKPFEKSIDADNKESDNGKLVLGHFGALSKDRNTKCLMQAIEEICNGNSSVKDLLSFIFIGNYDSNQKHLFDKLKSFASLYVRGKTTRKEALKAMHECSVLLLIQNKSGESSYSIPSKTYEYFNSGVPVFALTYNNKELEEIVRGLGHYCADQADLNAVKKEILRLINDWESGSLCKNVKPSPYTTKHAVEQLLSIV